jgi:hypothetical protein
MNTFAVLLLAFPFYLAVSGRLVAYTSLVQKQQQSTGGAAVSEAVSSVPTVPMG